MPKTIYRPEHMALLGLLKKHRKASGLTQVECSKALNRPQSFISDVENGTRRLDIVQLRDLCLVLGISLPELAQELENAITTARQ
ncbi:helix-turn-helix transcriptional regulator [Pseudomonas aeruginosa]|uniref:helix-turn-helix domain-containing protein n=1 Tax=Pseudomonas aeruginosa TaxID=287 RepID=UPI000455BE1E|nr:helix-turn-helix transcriptional regulator [Pseudomonas aeruginosa]MBG5228343.1 helix-turn-helix transcriptional regulator [Pseudomonas aeruginosa]MBG6353396.1 helix-turn-helix transcriptional regulator [Pseudomonas aeruginosa]MBH8771930.1 helix-turn-helix transcriptional regulator [Pseudomonas aeruginosa]MBH9131361.1 helix-turn-helix transcriptional regulator [Pseudomonas aeruginosa]MBH9167037.1 helix-turn-helix transcriptional regulator [Pseudomonas aeruginosa]